MNCMICRKDCSFIAAVEGMCLDCFDSLQLLGAAELATRLVKAQQEVNRLETENKQLSECDGLPTAGAQYAHALNTIADLRGIVEKLPVTADGVRVVPGMRLWTSYNNGRDVTGFDTKDGRLTRLEFRDGFDGCSWAHYSTPEAANAAEAARAEQ